MYHDDDKPDFAEAEGTTDYNPSDDKIWSDQIQKLKGKPRRNIVVTLFIVIPTVIIVAFSVTSILYASNGDNYYNPWSEGKTAVGSIKAVVDTYRAKHNGDISSLDEPKGTLNQGLGYGSILANKLRLDVNYIETLQYFDADDFSIEFVTDGTDGFYIIKLVATEGGGLSGNGPEGSVTYNSQTKEWKEDY